MKATINGLRYDTARAVLIGSASHGDEDISPQHWSEASLYRSPRATRFFLAGRGGLMTTFRGGCRIIPMSSEEAHKWASDCLAAELKAGLLDENKSSSPT